MFRTINLKKLRPQSIFIGSAFALGLSFGLIVSAAGPVSAETDARSAYYERSAALSLDTRCGLLPANARMALEAATHQARGALLRGGVKPAEISADSRLAAQRAGTLDCDSKDAKTIASRINSSFAVWTTLLAMDFPGAYRTWEAHRNPYDGWLVSQNVAPNVRFGVKILKDETVTGALELPAAMGIPSSARLVLRDPSRARDYIASGSEKTLAGRVPPSGATRSFYANDRLAPVAATKYRPASGRVFCFPKSALDALKQLDPREAASVVLEYSDPSRNKTYLVEAGDLLAANAFVGAQAGSLKAISQALR